MSIVRRCTGALALAIVLCSPGCGGGAGPDSAPPAASNGNPNQATAARPPAEPTIAAPSGRGELKSAALLARISASDISAAIKAAGYQNLLPAPQYSITAYRLTYLTLDGLGQQVVASGLVAVPEKPAGRVSPVLSYQHPTIFHDAEAPSNALQPGQPPIVMASFGAIVVAADYVGYGVSKGAQHPYLLSAPTAASVVDLLTAARVWRQNVGIPGNGQLFLGGYSEGGYATVAAQRAIQADGASPHLATLVGSVPGGGPYHVGATMDAVLDRVRDESAVLGALVSPGLLSHLGSTLRNEVRRQIVKQIIPDDADVAFQTTFIDNFLADDEGAIERDSNVHDWRPAHPIRLFHGRADRTVTYNSATLTLQAMQARGAPSVLLTDCQAVPADHIPCAGPYWLYMLGQIGSVVRDL